MKVGGKHLPGLQVQPGELYLHGETEVSKQEPGFSP